MDGLQRRAEVGDDDLAGQRAGFVARQEEQHVGDVLGQAGLHAQVHVLHHLAEHVLIQRRRIGLGHRGQDGGGIDGVAADARAGEAHGGVLGQADDGRLGGHVGRAAAAEGAGNGVKVDDGAAVAGDHVLEDRAGAVHGALGVDGVDPVAVLVAVDVDRLEARLEHAGVVDEDINLVEGLDGLGGEVLAVLDLGDVRLHDQHLAAGSADLSGNFLQLRETAGADDDLRAFLGKELRSRGADAGVAARDDSDLVVQTTHNDIPPEIIAKDFTIETL